MADVTWKFKDYFKADAQKCYEEMGTDGITPQELLEKAKNESTELHKCFEWDDSVAGEKYRLMQARQVIQFLVVREDSKEESATPPQRVFQISSEKTVYQPTEKIVRNKDEYKILLERAYAELQAFRRRYENLVELEIVFDAIDAL